ncbi:hypothetical protein CS022_22295 [Veronia nyctiphanis]|uniref:Bacterial toxin YdaT domain-containing protein n=1 Tax=Veronia nyctiphanis TaxID=1278244 RepID=A0A4Q0YJZ7_9GAMM|nr:hypothetical protein [Veronia nyctiphanis]RXJ70763.1 hypothetical protein CS022_22295 [Veronia nyctiphanis]
MTMTINKHRLQLLHKHLQQWMERPRMNQTQVANDIVEHFRFLGLEKQLQVEDIFFMDTGDPYTDMNTNRQKVFRWLGLMDNGTKRSPARLFFVEQAIVAAMPPDIRLAYLNDVYPLSGLYIGARPEQGESLNCDKLAAALTKENMEAQLSVIELSDRPDCEPTVCKAYRELKESAATTLAAIDVLESHYPQLTEQRPVERSAS